MQEQESGLRTIGKYQILGPLGRGSMGLVYKARDPEIGRIVAIKTLRKILSSDAGDVEAAIRRFKFEARSAGNLRHPNIITIFEVNHDGDTPYIVMDYVEGESLDAVIEASGKMNPALMVRYLSQAAAGLDYAHSRGVVHRDIKPSNLLVDKSGNVFILDFGIASINESFPDAENSNMMNPIMGTPGYMSPEQVLNEKLDQRTDLFSLAVVAFECLTGQRPFPGDNFTSVIGNILNSKPLSLTALVPELPLALEAEFERALAKKKEDRFESADHMVTSFARAAGVQAGSSAVARTSAQQGRQRKLSAWRTVKKAWGSAEAEASSSSSATRNVETPLSRPSASVTSTQAIPGGAGQAFGSPWANDKGKDWEGSLFGGPGPQAQSGPLPGDMFSHVDSSIRGEEFVRMRNPLIRIATLVLLAFCVGTAGFLFYLSGEGKTARDAKERDRILSQNAPSPKYVASSPQVNDVLSMPAVDPVPQGKSIHEMTDREVLGVLVKGGVSEELTLDALREAQRRALPSLVDASVVPLQNDSFIIRSETIKVLGTARDRRIVPQLMLALDDHDPVVRREAVRALGKLGDRRALAYLSSRLLKEESEDLKAEIKTAIESINGFPMR